jgi:lysophospholipase L1-like esterase
MERSITLKRDTSDVQRRRHALWLPATLSWLALAAPAHASPPERYYLALGDSHAFGLQFRKFVPGVPASAFDTGYADALIATLPGRTLVNYGCPGESTVSFIHGPCEYRALGEQLHDDYDTSQLTAAVAFLRGHPGRTELVTVTLWGNDVRAFVDACQGDLGCVQARAPAAIAEFSARLTVILATIRLAAGPRAVIVVTGAFDPNLQPVAQLTHPLFVALDQAIEGVAQRVGVRFAALFARFDGDAALCALTLLCTDGDAHPSDAGYQAIADAISNAIRR